MDSTESSRLAATLGQRSAAGADSAWIADAVCSAWQQIDAVLSPIVGQRGAAALYKRSLYLGVRAHPWLAAVYEGAHDRIEPAALSQALAQQSSADAASAGGGLLDTFHELLTSMVGPSLTERLLRSVWDSLRSGPTAQDDPP